MALYRVGCFGSNWNRLIGDQPIGRVLHYVARKWLEYSLEFQGEEPPLDARAEPLLTLALTYYLRRQKESGQQTIAGDFNGEVSRGRLSNAGMPVTEGRTDIEWQLDGHPLVILEFKLLDGSAKLRGRYIQRGVMRFINGLYSPQETSAAMVGLLRPGAETDPVKLYDGIKSQAIHLRSPDSKTGVSVPSVLARAAAAFDSRHQRDHQYKSPFSIAHMFLFISVSSSSTAIWHPPEIR